MNSFRTNGSKRLSTLYYQHPSHYFHPHSNTRAVTVYGNGLRCTTLKWQCKFHWLSPGGGDPIRSCGRFVLNVVTYTEIGVHRRPPNPTWGRLIFPDTV